MSVFVDTSALLAVLDADDEHHRRAGKRWKTLLETDEPLLTSNYVLVETHALAQHRLGIAAVRALVDDVVPALEIHWIDAEDHARAVSTLLTAGRRRLSLVDCASFAVMRSRSVARTFAYDRHFRAQGFDLLG